MIIAFNYQYAIMAQSENGNSKDLPQKLTLTNILKMTAENYEIAAALKAEQQAIEADYRQKTNWANPQFGIVAGQKDSPTGDSGLTWGINLSQPFAAFGEREALKKLAYNQTLSHKKRIKLQLQQVQKTAILLAYHHLAAAEKIKHADKRVARLELLKRFLYSRPFISPQKDAEKQIVEEKLRMMQLHLEETKIEYNRSWSELNAFLHLVDRVDLSLDWRIPVTRFKNLNKDEVVKNAMTGNYTMAALRAEIEANKAEANLNEARAWPEYALSAYYNQEPSSGTERFYGAGITFALPVWNRNSDGIEAANKKSEAALLRLKYFEKQMAAQAEQLISRYNLFARTAEQLSFEHIDRLENNMKRLDQGFRKGRVELLTYLEVDETIHDSITETYQNQINLIESGIDLLLFEGRPVSEATDVR